ncbi:MAG: ribosomal-protein-alanine N-acetyltransferase [Proteobacteria bacterium]|nr:MAG: ribosomal-protein-alanine N-acetyltransferase [Pseudomonadota bacterium]
MKPPTSHPVICRLKARIGAQGLPVSKKLLLELVQIDAHSNRPPWNTALFESEFLNPHAWIFGARLGQGIAGYLICHLILDQAHIVNFAVDQRYRGTGVGSGLLGLLLEDLQGEGARQVSLEVRSGNQLARKLYEKFGFTETGLRVRYYSDDGEDAVLMTRNLDSSNRLISNG